MTDTSSSTASGTNGNTSSNLAAPSLLFATGGLLSVTIIISRIAATNGAPMLWFLTVVMAGAGAILLAAAFITGQANGDWRKRIVYSAGAGAIQAGGMALAFLSVGHVGAGYVALAFAFPLLVTYVLALAVRMEAFSPIRALGVIVALVGGLMITAAKFDGLAAGGEEVGWVIAASAIPFVVAAGNLYRTRFWPKGAEPVLLAALMLLLAAAFTGPMAVLTEHRTGWNALWADSRTLTLLAANIAAFASQFVVYFKLQEVAGPVYLSQIGSVGAVIGVPVAVYVLGEAVPDGFLFALALIIGGAALFQISTLRRR